VAATIAGAGDGRVLGDIPKQVNSSALAGDFTSDLERVRAVDEHHDQAIARGLGRISRSSLVRGRRRLLTRGATRAA
jgi:hypothetical protein